MRVIKKIVKILVICVIVVAALAGLLVAYYEYCIPQIIKDFELYEGLTFDPIEEVENYSNKLYYQQLTESEARYYQCMYHAATNGKTEFYIETIDNDEELWRASEAFTYDYPEYFWFEKIEYDTTNEKDSLGVLPYYFKVVRMFYEDITSEDVDVLWQQIRDKLDTVLPTLIGENDYETILNAYKYVIDNTEYDIETIDTQDIRASFLDGKAVCASYAETFQLLCNQLGYECYSVQGDGLEVKYQEIEMQVEEDEPKKALENDSKHEWNIIKIDDEWYWVDPTWGDHQFVSDDPYLDLQCDMRYFLVPDEIMSLDHVHNSDYEYPTCKDFSYFYNDNIGVVLDSFDKTVVEDVLTEAFKNKQKYLIYQFYNEEDLKKFMDWSKNGTNLFNVYEYRVYPYYSGVMNTWVKADYSAILFWNINNLY